MRRTLYLDQCQLLDFISLSGEDFEAFLSGFPSQSTQRSYRRFVLEFLQECFDSGVESFYYFVEDGDVFRCRFFTDRKDRPSDRVKFFAVKKFIRFYGAKKGFTFPDHFDQCKPAPSVFESSSVVSENDARRLMQSALAVSDTCYLAIVLAYCAGLNVSVMLRLRADCFFTNGNSYFINIPPTIRADARTVEISGEVFRILANYVQKRCLLKGSFLFAKTPVAEKAYGPRAVGVMVEKACALSGVSTNLRGLRTSYIAAAVQSGAWTSEISDYSGVTSAYVSSMSSVLRGTE